MIRDQKEKMAMAMYVYQWRKWNKYVENKMGILYNNTVNQLKGM